MDTLKRNLGMLCLALFFLIPLFADIRFEGLDLSADGRLLYAVQVSNQGSSPEKGLFISDLEKNNSIVLTAFPKKIDLLDESRIIQIQNSFGTFRIPSNGGLPQSVPGFPGFTDGAPPQTGQIEAMASSYDGKWILYVEPVTSAYGNLVLIDVASGKRSSVASHIERPGKRFPAIWSRDSRVFIYTKDGKLYYHTLNTLNSASVDEQFRLIGDGQINSVYWGPRGDFFYIQGRTVYKVRSAELFARSLYTSFLEIGQVAGILPFAFDPAFDLFWIHPESKAIVVSKSGQILFYFPLRTSISTDTTSTDLSSFYPYLVLPALCSEIRLLWSTSDIITLWGLRADQSSIAFAYRMDVSKEKGPYSFIPLALPAVSDGLLAPDGTKAVLWGDGGCFLYNYQDWKPIFTISKKSTFAARWLNNDELIIGDTNLLYRFKQPDNRTILSLSKADAFGYEDKTGAVLAKSDDIWFRTDGNTPWSHSDTVRLRPTAVSSDRFRVYLENQGGSPYQNIPMVRSIDGLSTKSLILPDGSLYEPISNVPAQEGMSSINGVFNNGRRYGLRMISLTFDVIDSPEGLTTVLETLKQYGIRATFFINGEFIRRYGESTRLLAASGHEIGSLFFAPIDLADTRYRVDDAFIKRGLARNEDEYFQTTGKELSSIWHAPFYILSPELIAAASAAGYKTIGRDIDPFDWVSKTDVRSSYVPYRSASEIVDQIMKSKRPGSIIPVRIGTNEGSRTDYLFNRLDVLLDALLRAGYQIVPVSTLMENSK